MKKHVGCSLESRQLRDSRGFAAALLAPGGGVCHSSHGNNITGFQGAPLRLPTRSPDLLASAGISCVPTSDRTSGVYTSVVSAMRACKCSRSNEPKPPAATCSSSTTNRSNRSRLRKNPGRPAGATGRKTRPPGPPVPEVSAPLRARLSTKSPC